MKNLKPGRYRLVTTSSFGKGGAVKKTVNISYKPQSKMQFRASKIIRKGNGDVYQRLYFKRIIPRARPAMPRFSIKQQAGLQHEI